MKITYLNQALIISVSFLGFVLALWSYLANTRAVLNRIFFLLVNIVILNIVFSFLVQAPIHQEWATYWLRLVWLTGSLLIPAFYFFSLYFPRKIRSQTSLNVLFILLGLIFSFFSICSNFLVEGVSSREWGNQYLYGPGINLFYFALLGSIVVSFWMIIKKYLRSSEKEQMQIKYFMLGTAIYIAASIIFSIFFPILLNTTEYTYLGDYSVIFFLCFTAYAILKYQLFNVKVIATEVSVVALSISLFVEVFLSGNLNERLVKSLIWVLATYGGYVLIKSIHLEIKQKEELEDLAECLEDANKKLEELDETKDNFLSMASHELNTPIAAIEGYLSMIIDEGMTGKLNPKLKKYLGNVFVSSKRLAALVRDLLNVSRIESNRIHIIYSETQIEEVIEQSISEVKFKAKEQDHSLTFKKPAHKLPKTWLDQPRIIEVIINLLGNAIKYTNPGGKIVVEAHSDDSKIIVSVTDNGRGIPEDKYDHIFEKFSQVDVMKDEVKGTGLGMFISKNLIRLHHGKIWFKSSVDPDSHGTTFYFSIPILKEKPFDKYEGQGEVLKLK